MDPFGTHETIEREIVAAYSMQLESRNNESMGEVKDSQNYEWSWCIMIRRRVVSILGERFW